MAILSGTVSLSQLTDLEMARVFEAKAAAGTKFTVQLPVTPGQALASTTQANFHWSGMEGLEAVHSALNSILKS